LDEHLADPYLPLRLSLAAHPGSFTSPTGRRSRLFNAGYDPRTCSAGLIGFISAFVPGRAGVTAAV